MTVSDFVLIFATLLAPILAVQVQKALERRRESQKRKLDIFKTLMATRASRLSLAHVEALNMIDVEFYEKKYRRVADAWKVYRDHLNNSPKNAPEAQITLWLSRIDDLLADLLYEMGRSLRYDFDKVHIKRATYLPQAIGDMEDESTTIRKALIDILTGKHPIPMTVVDFPNMEESDSQKQFQQTIIDYLQKGEPVPVKVISEQDSKK